MKRKKNIKNLIIHCSDTEIGNAKIFDRYHKSIGFRCIGYHYVILKDGTLEYGRDDKETGAHCKGQNTTSIGICLVGKKSFTYKQHATLQKVVGYYQALYPGIKIKGHYHFSSKSCPNFIVNS